MSTATVMPTIGSLIGSGPITFAPNHPNAHFSPPQPNPVNLSASVTLPSPTPTPTSSDADPGVALDGATGLVPPKSTVGQKRKAPPRKKKAVGGGVGGDGAGVGSDGAGGNPAIDLSAVGGSVSLSSSDAVMSAPSGDKPEKKGQRFNVNHPGSYFNLAAYWKYVQGQRQTAGKKLLDAEQTKDDPEKKARLLADVTKSDAQLKRVAEYQKDVFAVAQAVHYVASADPHLAKILAKSFILNKDVVDDS